MKQENKPLAHLDLKKLIWIAATLVALATFIVYLPALQNGFVNWDDNVYVYENRHIQIIDFDFLKWIFTVEANPTWHPLTLLSLAIDYALWGLNPVGYHLTNIILHAINALLVFLLVIKIIEQKTNLTKKAVTAGIVTALLFGIHPLHVESVAWVSERKDVLYSFFFLLSVIVYLRYVSANLKRYYLLSLIFFILSLMSKPMAVSLPIVLLIIDCYPLNRLKAEEGLYKKILIEKIPFLVLSFLTALMAVWAQHSGEALASLERFPFVDRSFISIRAYIFYLVKMVLPFDLAPFYPYTKPAYFTYEHIGSMIFLLATTLFALFKKNRLYSAIWFYYIVTLLPVIGVVKVGAFAAADRYTYLPSLGPSLLASLGIAALLGKYQARRCRLVLMVALFLILSILGLKTARQISIWKDSMTLWSYEIKHFPNTAYIAYNNRGDAYYKSSSYQEAIRDFSRAVEINPRYADAYNNRGEAYYSSGSYQEAIRDFSRAVEINPRYANAYYHRGKAYYSSGSYQEAIRDFSRAVEINPGYLYAYYYRGNAYDAIGDHQLSIKDFDRAIEFNNPKEKSMAYNNRGIAYYAMGNIEQAINDCKKAVELDPKNAEANYNLGAGYSKAGNIEQALIYYKKAAGMGLKQAQDYLKKQGINPPPHSSSSGYP